MIIIIDFGSQTAHLISRRIRDLGIPVKITGPEDVLDDIKKKKPRGIILSGGPAFVNEKNSPTVDKKIYDLGIPILGICYGMQLTGYLLGGDVKPGKVKEFGPAIIAINKPSKLFTGLPAKPLLRPVSSGSRTHPLWHINTPKFCFGNLWINY